jgi:hypothetical protein
MLAQQLNRFSRGVESVDWNTKLLVAMMRDQIELDLPAPIEGNAVVPTNSLCRVLCRWLKLILCSWMMSTGSPARSTI